jgi:hypothetical protein
MTFLAHYLFNEAPVQNAVTAVDIEAGGSGAHSGSYFFTASPSDGALEPGGIGGRHTYIAQSDSGSVSGLGNIADLRITGEMSVAFWYYTDGVDAWHPIIEMNGVDETQPENKLFEVSRQNSNRLSMTWEHSAGTDVLVLSASNIVQNFNQWLHCAVVRKANGGNFDVEFYVDGALVDTQDNGGGGYTGPDGGGNSLGFIGRNQASTEPTGAFRIDSLRVYNNALSSGDVGAIYLVESAAREAYGVLLEDTKRTLHPNSGMGYIAFLTGERNDRGYGGFR